MKIIYFLLFCLLFAGQEKLAAQGGSGLCAIAFYNTENLFHPTNDPDKEDDAFTPAGPYKYTWEIYKQKLHNISIVLNRIAKDRVSEGAALIGLAEIENGQVLADLTSQPLLKSKGYKYIWYDGPDPRSIDVALLYDPKVFRPLSSRPVNPRIPGSATRDILYVTGILYRDTVHLMVNHWPSRRDGKEETDWERKKAADANRRLVDSIQRRRPDAKVIVMGDLNDNPADESITEVLRAIGSSPALKKGELYNPWVAIHQAGTGTLQYKRKWDLFDQVLCSSSLLTARKGLKYHSATVFNKEFLQQLWGKFKGSPFRSYRGTYWMNGYSDHYPVILYLSRI